MKTLLVVGCLSLIGCTKTPISVSAPNQKLVISLQFARDACIADAPFVKDANASRWIGVGCPAAINTAIATIQSPGFTGKASTVLVGIQAFLATEPSVIPSGDQPFLAAEVALINQFIVDYRSDFPAGQ